MRRSVAFWRIRPAAKVLGWSASVVLVEPLLPPRKKEDEEEAAREGARRWDSAMRRRSSRSWARREGASSGRVLEGVVEDLLVEEGSFRRALWSGGREDWRLNTLLVR